MQFRSLGKTGIKVSSLCFGTMSFGGDADKQESAKMFTACRDAGINFFDSANIYQNGEAEKILGSLISECRDELIITTKAGFGDNSQKNIFPGLSRRNIVLSLDASLKRLKTDRVDILFCHCFDDNTNLDETLIVLDHLIKQGKIIYAGISNWSAWQVARALGRCETLGLSSISVIQPMYNLAKRTAEIEILPMAKSEKLGVISYSPLGGGLLTGKYNSTNKNPNNRLCKSEMYSKRYGDQIHAQIAKSFTAYAEAENIHPVTLAVAWVMANPAITAPIIGARNKEQLQPALNAANYMMTINQWNAISALTPPVPVSTDRDENSK